MIGKVKKNILLSVCMVLLVILFSSGVVSAETTPDKAKEGIVRLCIGYVTNEDADGRFYSVKETCGCLVSNSDNNVYIVAPYHSMDITKKEKKNFLKKNKLKKENVTLARKVYISDDMKSDIEIVTVSEQNDFCLLSVDDVIKEKVPLHFKKSDTVRVSEKVNTVGYGNASEIFEGKIKNISNDKNGAKYIEHTAKISDENLGGALVDEKGYFLGMNNEKYNKNGIYYSLRTDKIKELLDNRGILYFSEENDEAVSDLKNEFEKCKKIVQKNEYRTASKETLKQVIEKVNESLDTAENITLTDATNLKKELETGEKQLVKKTSKIIIFQVVLGITDVIFIAWLITLIIKNKKGIKRLKTIDIEEENDICDKRKNKEMRVKGEETKRNMDNNIDEIGATVKLSAYIGQKNIFENRRYIAYLRRKKDNSYVLVDRETFIIGKNIEAVNYHISDNKMISRVHAGIQWENENYVIYDMGSVNGTYVNNVKIIDKPIMLKNGDIILLANEYFQFLITEKK